MLFLHYTMTVLCGLSFLFTFGVTTIIQANKNDMICATLPDVTDMWKYSTIVINIRSALSIDLYINLSRVDNFYSCVGIYRIMITIITTKLVLYMLPFVSD